MLPSFLLAFREGLEAALILGLILSVLRRVGHANRARIVWLGAGLAVLISLAAGLALQGLGMAIEGRAEQIFEGLAMLTAAAVLTWMIFWMDRQGRAVQSQLESDTRQAALAGGAWALFSLAFVAVVREGIELALFLTAAAFTTSARATLAGGVLGLAAAGLCGWLVFATTARLNVRAFFQVTGIVLIFFAAGLVAHGVHELNEAGWIPALVEHVWDTNPVLDEESAPGQILKALFGYNGNPSLTEVIAYVAYWVAIVLGLRRARTEREMAGAIA